MEGKYEQFEFVYCIFSCKFATCCITFAFVRMSIKAVTYLLTYLSPGGCVIDRLV